MPCKYTRSFEPSHAPVPGPCAAMIAPSQRDRSSWRLRRSPSRSSRALIKASERRLTEKSRECCPPWSVLGGLAACARPTPPKSGATRPQGGVRKRLAWMDRRAMELTLARHERYRHQAVVDVGADVSGERGAEQPSAAAYEGAGGRSADQAVGHFRRDVQRDWAPVDPAGATAQVDGADRALLGAQRAAAVRAARLQPAVSLVLGHGHDRASARPQHVFAQPRTPARARRRREVFPCGRRASATREADER